MDETAKSTEDRIVYHYTNQAGLLGIVNSGEIWASKIQYLNDSSEFRATCEVAEKCLEAYYEQNLSINYRNALAEIRKRIKSITNINVCVCSFSQDGDSLSQWRAYGGALGGYAIGFSLKRLRTLAFAKGCDLVQCSYDQTARDLEVQRLIDRTLPLTPTANPEPISIVDSFSSDLWTLAPKFKDPAFKHEQEWRLFTSPVGASEETFAYRTGHSMIIPYFRFHLGDSLEGHPIVTVIVGPTPHPELAKQSVQSLLMSKLLFTHKFVGLENVDLVSLSQIPYRGW